MIRNIARLMLLVFLAGTVAVQASEPAVTGFYRANGESVTPVHARAAPGERYMDAPTYRIVLSEKDASSSRDAAFDAQMDKLRSARVIKLAESTDGFIVIGSEFAHPHLRRSGASASGILQALDVVVANGEIRGRLVSVADASLFDDSIEIDLEFRSPIK
ncbi:MAG: hypothetical protein ABI650_02395 [Dokdonella sp.]